MNFSGRSVEAPSLVIEIEEVLVAISAAGRSLGKLLEDLTFDILFFGRGFDHHVAIAEQRIVEPGRDARHRRIFFVLANPAARDLAREIAVDRVAAALHRLLADVGHHHVEPGERADMRDAAAHLPGTDNADPAQPGERHDSGEDAAALTGGARARRRAPAGP